MDASSVAENRDPILLSWRTPEFIIHPRGKVWFLAAGLLTIGAVAYSLISQSITTALVFLLLGGVYFLTHNQQPRMIDIKITQLGLWIHQTFYPYNTVRSFWIVYNPPFVRTLNLETTKRAFSRLTIQLNAQDPVPVHEILSKKIPEAEGMEESFADICIRLLRL